MRLTDFRFGRPLCVGDGDGDADDGVADEKNSPAADGGHVVTLTSKRTLWRVFERVGCCLIDARLSIFAIFPFFFPPGGDDGFFADSPSPTLRIRVWRERKKLWSHLRHICIR